MSATYIVNGYVDIRVRLINEDIHASQSSSPKDIAELVCMKINCATGNSEILNHKLMIREIGK
jgi:hypothetical protein